ncbi:hypothetical protein [Candidatus Nitrotoga sp. 1052]|uniref:hypothetical protein n=1 Tax=Candidatus Nitrotoga sp. 1052 TaxID=2886964 RepID=UPI001EF6E985|nr:hypothetical protein [Candidatus Nitrotoga sp. 1052]CAH1091356.1 hypothetical protein NTG1052_860031 [Candidatus Nitrotoga sp. 1052]
MKTSVWFEKIPPNAEAGVQNGVFLQRRWAPSITYWESAMHKLLFAISLTFSLVANALGECPKGYQPYANRCVTQKMADYISCVEATGGNKQEITDELSRVDGNKTGGSLSASGGNKIVKGAGAITLDKKSESTIVKRLEAKWFAGSMSECAKALKLQSTSSVPPEVKKTLDSLVSVKLDLWRDRYGISSVSGGAWIVIDLLDGKPKVGLSPWLYRVEERYKALKASNVALDASWISSDVKGDEYLEINSLTSPKKNWDLIPEGESEKFVDELLFHSKYILLATNGQKHGLLLSPFSFKAEATSVKIYFDSITNKPNKIEGFAQGKGEFTPIPGQFNNWVDFYGATLITRQIFLSYPLPEAFTSVEYRSITFDIKGNNWSPSATFAEHTGADLYTDKLRSLIVQNADWRTLGQVPGDYPGKRLALYGLPPKPW